MAENDTPRRRGAPLQGEVKKVRRTVTIDPKVWDDAAETAASREESVSSVVEDGLRKYAKRHGAKE